MTLTEFKSVLKNLELLGWKTPPLIDLIISKSTSKIEKTVEKTIDSDDQGQDRWGSVEAFYYLRIQGTFGKLYLNDAFVCYTGELP